MKSMRQTRQVLVGLIVATFCGLAQAKESPATKVRATGVAAIYQGDKATARDRAIADAQRKAVEQAVGTLVSSETVTENFQLLSDKVYSKAQGYVRKYTIISTKEDAGTLLVEIDAEVHSGNLKNDLDGILAVLKAKNLPRVLVMVTEQNVGSASTAMWWQGEKSFSLDLGAAENAIVDSLKQKGFSVVDRQALQGKIRVTKALDSESPPDDAVKEFAANTGAEVVIQGKAFANDIGTIMGTQMHSIRANISLRALYLDNGSILATATDTGTVGHIDPTTGGTQALTKVARKATGDLLGKILSQWEKEVAGPTTVMLTVKNVSKSKFRRVLTTFLGNEIRGVQEVRDRGFRNKVAEFEVDITGSASTLAEELEEKKFGEFGVEIQEVSANKVIATLTGK